MSISLFWYKYIPLHADFFFFFPPAASPMSMVGWPWLAVTHIPSCSHLRSSTGQEERMWWKSVQTEIKTGRPCSNYCRRHSRLNLGKINLIYCQLEHSWMMRSKWKHPPLTHFSFQAELRFVIPSTSTSLPPWAVQVAWEVERLQPVHNSSSLLLLSPHASPLLQCGSLELQSFTNSSLQSSLWAIVQQDKPFPLGVLQPQFLQENLLLWGLLSMGCTICQGPTPLWAPHRLQLPSGHIYLLQSIVLHELEWGFLLWCDLFQVCKGMSALVPGTPSPPPSLSLVFAGLFLLLFFYVTAHAAFCTFLNVFLQRH